PAHLFSRSLHDALPICRRSAVRSLRQERQAHRVIRIELPKALNCYVDGKSVLELDEKPPTVRDALAALGRRSPGVLDRVMDEQGDRKSTRLNSSHGSIS